MITLDTSPLYLEQKICDTLGLDRDDMRAIRKEALTRNEDYGQRGREVVLCAVGLVKLLGFLREKGAAIPSDADFSDCMHPSAKKEDPATPPTEEPIEMVVIRKYPNDRLLLCRDPQGASVNVRVKNNENFRPEMSLRARWDATKTAYVMEGRCPRYPGRY